MSTVPLSATSRPPRRLRIQSLGLSSRDVPLDERERFVRAMRGLPNALTRHCPGAPLVIVETCHRLELLWVDAGPGIERHLRRALRAVSAEADFLVHYRTGHAAVRHLFGVALGLDSPIPGEREVARQLRGAWQRARAREMSHPLLDRAIAAALAAARRANAADSHAACSVAGESVRQLRAHDGPRWSDARIVVLGAGVVARDVVRELLASPPACVTVVSRAPRAWPASVRLCTWDRRAEALREADLVIVATGADRPVLAPEDVARTPVRRIVDLALPRNVDPRIAHAGAIDVIELDTVLHSRWTPDRQEVDRLRARRQVGVHELARFRASEAVRAAGTHLARLHEDGALLAIEEASSTLRALGTDDAAVRAGVESLAGRLARLLLYRTSIAVREIATLAAR